MIMAAPVFPHASVSEILLCSIKDEYYIHALEESVYAIIEAVKGPHVLAQFKPEAKAMASFAYYSVTSGTGLQTLGEEYVNIFQIHKMKPAPKSVRWILILLRILVPYIVQRSKAGWANIVTTREAQFRRSFRQNRRFSSPDQPSSGSQSLKALDTFIGRVKRQYVSAVGFNPLPALESIHLALFYIYGKYPHVFTRVTSIQYLRNQRLDQPPVSFTLIGCIILSRYGIQGLNHLVSRYRQRKMKEEHHEYRVPVSTASDEPISASSRHVCTVCLSVPESPVLTPCGHVFCWHCIVNTVPRQTKCALCREDFRPQELRCIYNY